MWHSLRAKFFFSFGALTVLLFLGLGIFLVFEKNRELSERIAETSQSFAETTVDQIMSAYTQFFTAGNTVAFQSKISAILRQNPDISGIVITDYLGNINYNTSEVPGFSTESIPELLLFPEDLERLQSQNMSLRLEDNQVIYIKIDAEGQEKTVNFNEEPIPALDWQDRIVNIVVPYDNAYTVVYAVNYEQVDTAIRAAQLQVVLGALVSFGAVLTLSYLMARSITRPIQTLKEGAVKLASGNFKVRVPQHGKDEVGLLGETFNEMAKKIEESTEARIFEERVAKELELAAEIQKNLLPDEKLHLKALDLAGGLVPASEIGGDVFDYLPLSDEDCLIYLGDVTGHGVAAGIISSISTALLYTLHSKEEVGKALKTLNQVIRKKTSQKVFVTLALLFWDKKKEKLHYWNAGHPPIFHFKAKSQEVVEYRVPGMALGLVEDIEGKLVEKTLSLEKGDVLILYSDGIPEARNPKGEEYGRDQLKALLESLGKDLQSAEAIKNAVLSDVIQFVGKDQHDDDMTIVVVKRT